MANGTLSTVAWTMTPVRHVPMEMVAGILHELQTPIAAILAAAENIRDGLLDDPDRLRDEGTTIVAHATRLMNLGDQILLYASMDQPGLGRDLRPLAASEVIDNAVCSLAGLLRQGGFTLERDMQSGLPPLRGDLQLLSHCLENLIANAVKYSGQSRWVGVSALVGRSSCSGREEISICVSDRGLGISAEDLPHIFEPFYRSRRPVLSSIRGSGLGLSIAKGCVEACGGRLSVVSQEGAGCAFTLHLPLYGGPADQTGQRIGGNDDGQAVLDVTPGSPFSPVEWNRPNLAAGAENCKTLSDHTRDDHQRMYI